MNHEARASIAPAPDRGDWLRFLGSLVRPLPLPGLASAAVRGMVRMMGALEAQVFLVDTERRELRLVAHDALHGTSGDPVRLDFGDPHPIARVALDRGLRVLVKPARPPPDRPGESGEHRIADTMVLAPLFSDRPLGCLSCRFAGHVHSDDVSALATTAHVLSALLASAILRDELRDREGLEHHLRTSAMRRAPAVPEGDGEAQRRWLEAMVEHAPIAILLLHGPDGARISANPGATRLLGQRLLPEEGLAGYTGRISAADGSPLTDPWAICRRALAGETTSSCELRLATPDGRELTVLASAAPVQRTADGIVDGAVVVMEDISEIRELQTLREQWTAVITHDLRQPIQALQLQMSKLGTDGGRAVQDSVARMRRSLKLLTRMVTDLGHRSAIEVRQIPLRLESTDLVRVALAVAETMDGVGVRVRTVGEVPPVPADPQRIEQVLGNLITNARKYGRIGADIAILIALSESADVVVVSVTNEGDGIDPGDLEKIFGRFYRSGQQRRGDSEGLGLGLYICKELIAAHGGHIWAESEKGASTAIRFSLPVSQPIAAE